VHGADNAAAEAAAELAEAYKEQAEDRAYEAYRALIDA